MANRQQAQGEDAARAEAEAREAAERVAHEHQAAQDLAAAEARHARKSRMSDDTIEVRTSLGARRRAGFSFTAVPTIIKAGAITWAQRQAIDNDPHLSVRVIDDAED